MAMRYPGGFISATAPTVSANSAKGIWTLEEAMQYVRAGTWPVPTGNGDPYFQYNTMLLPGQGTNGAQNNTFLDSSTNNFTITRNGNTTQGTFTPFSGTAGYWSTYLNGSSSLSVNVSGISAGTSTFTLEFWVYLIAYPGTDAPFVDTRTTNGASTTAFQFGVYSTGKLKFYDGTETNLNGSVPLNQWTHIALVRDSGNTVTAYINGVSTGTTVSSTRNFSDNYFWIASVPAPSSPYLNGFLSNLRWVVGSAVYTSAFTPPTSPLTAITNTKLLTLQSNRFVDNSANAYAITLNSTPQITPFQPFGAPTVAYSASTIGGSGYFDGALDYLTASSNAAFTYGTGAFTIEGWHYLTAASSSTKYLFDQRVSGQGLFPAMYIDAGSYVLYINSAVALTAGTVRANSWIHWALVKNGSTTTLYINGTSVGSVTDNNNYSTTAQFRIGSEYSGAGTYDWQGYLADVRVVKGTAVYTANFTPPTAPLTAITNTSLLCNFTNAGIIDNAQDNNLETVGNAQISTTQYKWGASSVAFDGTGDWLSMPAGSQFAFGTGDYTVEAWVYFTSITTSDLQIIFTSGSTGGNNFYFHVDGNQISVGTSAAFISNQATSFSTGTWYHVAACRTAGVLKLFVNGNQAGSSVSDTTNWISSGTARSGANEIGTQTVYGYIQDLRVSKYSRYPYNFTAPTAALPLFYQAAATPSADPYFDYTTLLLPGNGTNGAQNNTFLDSSTNAFTITRNGNTTQGTFTPFSQTGWSNYFDGTGDYLTSSSTTAFNSFITGSASGVTFTLEAWVYPTTTVAGGGGAWQGAPIFVKGATYLNFQIYNNKLRFYWYDGAAQYVDSGASVPLNTWTYVAVTVNGSSITLYVNGVASGTGTFTGISTAGLGGSEQIGYQGASGNTSTYYGYISNLRVSNNVRTISLPSSALTSDANTIYLTCQSNRFVDNSGTPKTFTVSGDTSVQAFSPFNPTAAYSTSTVGGSAYFDGSGDYLATPNNAALTLGTNNFTIEMWVYCPNTATAAIQVLYDQRSSGGQAVPTLYFDTNGTLNYYVSGSNRITSASAVSSNTWNHIAVERSSGTTKMYVNGAQVGSSYSDSTTYVGNSVGIGAYIGSPSLYFSGYISSLRVVNGTAVYSGTTFTPPTAPPTAITNTSLLLNYTNGGIIDNTAKNNLETAGGASISTAVSKFGGSSMYFDGTGDYLVVRYNRWFGLLDNQGDFTVEGWFYRTVAGASQFLLSTMEFTGTYTGWALQFNSSNNAVFFCYDSGNNPQVLTGTSAITASTWTHVAVSRYGGVTQLFVNGVSEATRTTAFANTVTQSPLIIGVRPEFIDNPYTGYMQDVRITFGIARYTQNFTPPTTAFLTL